MSLRLPRFTSLALLALGCAGAPPGPAASPPDVRVEAPRAIGSNAPEDPAVAAIVGRYKATLGERLSAVVATASADIGLVGEPSNPLGVLVADEMLLHLRGLDAGPVDCFISNDGGLRAPLYAGPVQLKHVFELMPFDNELVVVTVDGVTLQRIGDTIAKKNGEPVAGLRLHIAPAAAKATNIEVGGKPLVADATYHVGTSDYLADSGWMSELVKGRPVKRTGILMRDAITARFKARGDANTPLAPLVDDRIQVDAAGGAP